MSEFDDLRGLVRLTCPKCYRDGRDWHTVLIAKRSINLLLAGHAYHCECGCPYSDVVYG